MSGIANIIKDNIAPLEARLNRQKEHILDMQSSMQKALAIINEHDEMLRPQPVKGLPALRGLVYLAFTFYNNGPKPGKGKTEFNMKIEANKYHKYGNVKKDHVVFATMYSYEKFRKEVSKFTVGTEEQRARLLKIAATYSDDRGVLFGLVSVKGGPGGTTLLADQFVILITSGEGDQMKAGVGALMVGDDRLPIEEWHTADPKTGNPWGASSIVARAFINPQDYFAKLDEDAAYGIKPEGE